MLNMLTHVKVLVSAFSILYVTLSPVPEEALQRAEINRLARIKPRTSFWHVPPPPASVPLPTIEHVCLPCPDAAAWRLKAPMFLLVDPGGEERLHSERHAHRLGSREVRLRERDERKAAKAAKERSSLIISAAYRQALVKMKYETAALVPFVLSPYPSFPKPAKISPIQKTPWYSTAYNNTVSAFEPLRNDSIQWLKSSFFRSRRSLALRLATFARYWHNSSLGANLHIGSWDLAANFKSALNSTSVPDVDRHWQTVSRIYATVCQASVSWFDSHLRDHFTRLSSWLAGIPRALALTLGAVGTILVLVMVWFGFRWWRSRKSSALLPPSAPSDDSPDVPPESAPKPNRASRRKAAKSETRSRKHKAPPRTEPAGKVSRASDLSPAQARRMAKAGLTPPGWLSDRPLSPLESASASSSTKSRLSASVSSASPTKVSPKVVDTRPTSDSTLPVSDSARL